MKKKIKEYLNDVSAAIEGMKFANYIDEQKNYSLNPLEKIGIAIGAGTLFSYGKK